MCNKLITKKTNVQSGRCPADFDPAETLLNYNIGKRKHITFTTGITLINFQQKNINPKQFSVSIKVINDQK